MKSVFPATALLILAALATAFAACGEEEEVTPAASDTPAPDELETIMGEDANKPRFVGDIEGIFVAQSQEDVPAEYRLPECVSQAHVLVPWDQAGQFALNFQLPPQFIFQPDDMNTGVIACEGPGPYVARWAYELPLPQYVDYAGRIIIARGVSSWVLADASTDRVKTIDAGGRQAVLIEPVRPEGAGSLGHNGTHAAVMFPETFGMTSIGSIGVPLSDLLQIARIVGAATKK